MYDALCTVWQEWQYTVTWTFARTQSVEECQGRQGTLRPADRQLQYVLVPRKLDAGHRPWLLHGPRDGEVQIRRRDGARRECPQVPRIHRKALRTGKRYIEFETLCGRRKAAKELSRNGGDNNRDEKSARPHVVRQRRNEPRFLRHCPKFCVNGNWIQLFLTLEVGVRDNPDIVPYVVPAFSVFGEHDILSLT